MTFEYVMLRGVNDSLVQARELHALLRDSGLPSLVNLIPFNPWPGSSYKCSDRATIAAFAEELERRGQHVTVRWPRGGDILAACGQLKAASAAQAAEAASFIPSD